LGPLWVFDAKTGQPIDRRSSHEVDFDFDSEVSRELADEFGGWSFEVISAWELAAEVNID
jgi:hypothetical protein